MQDVLKRIKNKSQFDNFISEVKDYVFLFSTLIALCSALLAFSDKISIKDKDMNIALFFIFFLIFILWLRISIKGVSYFPKENSSKSLSELIVALEILFFCFFLIAPVAMIFYALFAQSPDSFSSASIMVILLFVMFGNNSFAEWMKHRYNSLKSSIYWIFGCILFLIVIIIAVYVCSLDITTSKNVVFWILPVIGLWFIILMNSVILLFKNLNDSVFHIHPNFFKKDKEVK